MSQVLSVVSIGITSNVIISIDIVSNHVPPQQQQKKRTFEKLFFSFAILQTFIQKTSFDQAKTWGAYSSKE